MLANLCHLRPGAWAKEPTRLAKSTGMFRSKAGNIPQPQKPPPDTKGKDVMVALSGQEGQLKTREAKAAKGPSKEPEAETAGICSKS